MQRVSAWLVLPLCAVALLIAIAEAAPAERLILLSTQLRLGPCRQQGCCVRRVPRPRCA
jgi:hypothetical protein